MLWLSALLFSSWPCVWAMHPSRMARLRQETVDMFYHGFDNYMEIAFPEDELRPVSCTPLSRDVENPGNYPLNDVLGNYSLTLIDSLSTLAILASAHPDDLDTGARALRDFQNGVAALVEQYGDGRDGPSGQGLRARGFDLDSKVQVFETVIRGVGGLLSAHLFAVGELPITGYDPQPGPDPMDIDPIAWPNGFKYDGQLLRLALDLARRLLPAFYTRTGMPYPRANLKYGIPFYPNAPLRGGMRHVPGTPDLDHTGRYIGPAEITETCSAGAGSLVLEFTVLTRLTGDPRFEEVAKRAFWAVWAQRSDLDLIGTSINPENGVWGDGFSMIGAGADSFFEYALKTHILLSGHALPNFTYLDALDSSADPSILFPRLSDFENAADSFLAVWRQAHAAIKRHLYSEREHPHYLNVNLWTGSPASNWVDSLGAYYSGLLALAGEVDEAIETNLLYTAIWTRYSALPERWSINNRGVEGGLGWWPLRPELVESTYHLYRATRDPWYLYVGEMMLRDIQRRCWTRCGWAGLQDVVNGEKKDRMESFFLGETAKYMYLLLDDRHPLNSLDAAYVFTTEGHPLILPKRLKDGQLRSRSQSQSRGAVTTSSSTGSSDNSDNSDRWSNPNVWKPRRPFTLQDVHAAYQDAPFTDTCPAPPKFTPLTGSVLAARDDLYHAARVLDLHQLRDSAAEPNENDGYYYYDDDDNGNIDVASRGDEELSAAAAAAAAAAASSRPNYSFFPWTLPAQMVPDDGTCAVLYMPIEMSLEFPNLNVAQLLGGGTGAGAGAGAGAGSSFEGWPGVNMKRLSTDATRVTSLSSLKLTLRLEEDGEESEWRVTRVNGLPFGRDEFVVLDRAMLKDIADPRFSLVRDSVSAKLISLHRVLVESSNFDAENGDDGVVVVVDSDRQHESESESESESSDSGLYESVNRSIPLRANTLFSWARRGVKQLARRFVTAASSSTPPLPATMTRFSGAATGGDNNNPDDDDDDGDSASFSTGSYYYNILVNQTAITSTGIGAAPLPPVDLPAGAHVPATGPVDRSVLPWTTVFAGGHACDGPLPESAPRDHNIILLRRGGCSFSVKLANVPAFKESSTSLQLVVVVSDDDDNENGDGDGEGEGAIPPHSRSLAEEYRIYAASSSSSAGGSVVGNIARPLLDEVQRTPRGVPRRNPVAVVMVPGGAGEYRRLAAADQLGLARRYYVESSGLRVRNIIVDEGDI